MDLRNQIQKHAAEVTNTEDSKYRAERGELSNPLCPDHSVHAENAFDYLYPAGRRGLPPLTAEEQELVDAEADAEYLACEGH
jgi:hypothetical protein